MTQRLMRTVRETRAFTLIEILIVISILGILAGVSVFIYNSALDGTSQQQVVDDYNAKLCTTAEAIADAMNALEAPVTPYVTADFTDATCP